jgi:serine protease Do
MKMWKAAALTTALLVSAALGAAFAPAATGQTITTWRPDQGVGLLFLGAGQIGVSIRDLDDEDAKAGKAAGVLIEDVTEGGPAEKAGLKKGDIVAEYDGEKVRSVRQFTRLVQETAAGRKVQVTVLRNGQRTSLTVEPRSGGRVRALGNLDRLGDLENLGRHFDFDYRVPTRPTPPNPPSPPRVPSFPDLDTFVWRFGGSTLGITVSDLSSQLADYFGTKDGVLVTSVVQDSAAGKAGLKAGDVITAVNGSGISSPSELRRRLQRLEAGDDFTIDVMRDKKPATIKGKIEEARERRRTFRSEI